MREVKATLTALATSDGLFVLGEHLGPVGRRLVADADSVRTVSMRSHGYGLNHEKECVNVRWDHPSSWLTVPTEMVEMEGQNEPEQAAP